MASINVVIPVYNAEKYIESTVNSILEQPEKDIEIVLVNDGSTDDSGRICDKISNAENRVHVIHKSNNGVSSARNVGIKFFLKCNESGYIAFCDSDDLWAPNAIDSVMMDVIKREEADIVGFSMYCSNPTATRFYINNKYSNAIIIKEKYETKHLFGGGALRPISIM